MKYELLVGPTPSRLNKVVNCYLARGWKLYGQPAVVLSSAGTEIYAQAVVKDKE